MLHCFFIRKILIRTYKFRAPKTIAYVLVLSPDAKCFLCCRMCNFHIEHDLVNDYDWCGCFVGLGYDLSFDDFTDIMNTYWYFHLF